MAFTLTFLPLCFLFTDSFNVFGNAQRAVKLPYKILAPQLFVYVCLHVTPTDTDTHISQAQAVNGAPVWGGDCAGQCAPLCDCMPPRLRLSLDTSQPSRPADLYPTVTLSERHSETERERVREGASRGIVRERDEGGKRGEDAESERLQ